MALFQILCKTSTYEVATIEADSLSQALSNAADHCDDYDWQEIGETELEFTSTD